MAASRDRDGFQRCAIDGDALVSAPVPLWERALVVVALAVHFIDVLLDLLVAVLFLAYVQLAFFFGTICVIIWAWLISSLYIAIGGGQTHGDGIDNDNGRGAGGLTNRVSKFFLNFAQVQIFVEAYRCIWQHGDTDYFHTLRLMEAILESAPNSLVQLYALVIWAGDDDAPELAGTLLRASVFASFISVGLGLAMWEQRVQLRTTASYIATVAVMRGFEIASRSLTLALFGGATHPDGFWWALIVDYLVMVILVAKHRSVQLRYGLFVALPLVLVSLEPLVWRREDHAVPKDRYYTVRMFEFVVMWVIILIYNATTTDSDYESSLVWDCEVLAVLTTLGLYMILPFAWRIARRLELLKSVSNWDEDGGCGEIMTNEGLISDSEEDEDRTPSDGSEDDADDDAGAE